MLNFKENDHVSITARDAESGEVDTFTARLIASDSSGLLVAPDDDMMGLLPTLFIKPNELIAIIRVDPS